MIQGWFLFLSELPLAFLLGFLFAAVYRKAQNNQFIPVMNIGLLCVKHHARQQG